MDCRYRYSIIKNGSNSGATLIELIVASVLVSITAGVVLTIFHIFNKETTQMLMNAKLQVQGEIILEEIARNTRSHHNVRCTKDSYTTSLDYSEKVFMHIGFYKSEDDNKADIGYDIGYDTLQYLNEDKLQIGKDYVNISPYNPENPKNLNSSGFVLNDGDKLYAKIVLTNVYQNSEASLTLPEIHFRCRY
jgi:hypothetical protein